MEFRHFRTDDGTTGIVVAAKRTGLPMTTKRINFAAVVNEKQQRTTNGMFEMMRHGSYHWMQAICCSSVVGQLTV